MTLLAQAGWKGDIPASEPNDRLMNHQNNTRGRLVFLFRARAPNNPSYLDILLVCSLCFGGKVFFMRIRYFIFFVFAFFLYHMSLHHLPISCYFTLCVLSPWVQEQTPHPSTLVSKMDLPSKLLPLPPPPLVRPRSSHTANPPPLTFLNYCQDSGNMLLI
jgi:hypothetical protein